MKKFLLIILYISLFNGQVFVQTKDETIDSISQRRQNLSLPKNIIFIPIEENLQRSRQFRISSWFPFFKSFRNLKHIALGERFKKEILRYTFADTFQFSNSGNKNDLNLLAKISANSGLIKELNKTIFNKSAIIKNLNDNKQTDTSEIISKVINNTFIGFSVLNRISSDENDQIIINGGYFWVKFEIASYNTNISADSNKIRIRLLRFIPKNISLKKTDLESMSFSNETVQKSGIKEKLQFLFHTGILNTVRQVSLLKQPTELVNIGDELAISQGDMKFHQLDQAFYVQSLPGDSTDSENCYQGYIRLGEKIPGADNLFPQYSFNQIISGNIAEGNILIPHIQYFDIELSAGLIQTYIPAETGTDLIDGFNGRIFNKTINSSLNFSVSFKHNLSPYLSIPLFYAGVYGGFNLPVFEKYPSQYITIARPVSYEWGFLFQKDFEFGAINFAPGIKIGQKVLNISGKYDKYTWDIKSGWNWGIGATLNLKYYFFPDLMAGIIAGYDYFPTPKEFTCSRNGVVVKTLNKSNSDNLWDKNNLNNFRLGGFRINILLNYSISGNLLNFFNQII